MKFKRVRISDCKPKPNYVLWLRFDDGLEGEVDLSDLVGKGVFKAWKVKKHFESVRIDPESGTVCWDDEIDLDPYVLYNDVLKDKKRPKPAKKHRKSTVQQRPKPRIRTKTSTKKS